MKQFTDYQFGIHRSYCSSFFGCLGRHIHSTSEHNYQDDPRETQYTQYLWRWSIYRAPKGQDKWKCWRTGYWKNKLRTGTGHKPYANRIADSSKGKEGIVSCSSSSNTINLRPIYKLLGAVQSLEKIWGSLDGVLWHLLQTAAFSGRLFAVWERASLWQKENKNSTVDSCIYY